MKNIEDIKKLKIFIAGPMRGYPNYNFDTFDAYENFLKDRGIECVNPGRISRKFKEVEVNNDINVYNEMVRLQQEAEKLATLYYYLMVGSGVKALSLK